jgi:hypothetical protein
MKALGEGRLDFEDFATRDGDIKTFDSDKVPGATLAVAKAVVDFTAEEKPTPQFDISRFLKDGVYTSSTGQLRWKPGTSSLSGWFSINAPGTKAVVGFADGQQCDLGEVSIIPHGKFGAIYVTAKEQNETVANAKTLIITALARARNKGMNVFHDQFLLKKGGGGVVLEPVRATITLKRQGTPSVELLDHNGVPTGRMLPVAKGSFEIDGTVDKTPYYRITYK